MWQKCADSLPPFSFHCDALGRDETDKILLRYRGAGNRAVIAFFYRYPEDEEIYCQTQSGFMQDNWELFEWCAIPE